MSFSEVIFAPFVILTFLFFFFSKRFLGLQILILLIASYVFYGWWNIKFIWLILFSTLLDYNIGALIYKAKSLGRKRLYLAISLIGNLGLLGYFKYTNFFIGSVQSALDAAGMSANFSTLEIVLPVGISFYTFQSLSYSLDIYYERIKPTKSALKFMFFVAAFPQLVAGPIVRAKDFLPQLETNLFDKSDEEGLFHILYGLIKKILIADVIGHYFVDKIFASPADFSSLELLLGVYLYAFQIFFDFSAYSDIAIGLGKIFGIQLPVNFRSPYLAKNPTEFWHRWHITLSTWLRDYLYIPLGGNRVNRIFHIRNLMIVMVLGGLWHGANWTFILWGALHGIYLVVHKLLPQSQNKPEAPFTSFIKIFLFFNLICLTWIFFRSSTIGLSFEYLKGLVQFNFSVSNVKIVFLLTMLVISGIVHYLPFLKVFIFKS